MDVKKYLTTKCYVVAIAMFCATLWGSAIPLLKTSYKELQIPADNLYLQMLYAGIRFLLASILLFIILKLVIKHSLKVQKNMLGKLFVLGTLQTTLLCVFFYYGLAHTTGIKAAILGSSAPFFVVLLAHFIYTDDKMNWQKIIGLIAGFFGIYIMNVGKGVFDLSFTFQGDGFMLLSGLVSALGLIMAKQLSKNIHPFLVTGWQMFLGSILLIVFGLFGLQSSTLVFTYKAWAILAYLVFVTAVAFSLWFTLLKYNKAGEIAIYNFVMPVAGAIVSIICIPGEKFSINIFVALAMVAIGIFAINYRKAKD